MHLLLIHQNFPAQFRELAPAWMAAGHTDTAIRQNARPLDGPQWQNLKLGCYSLTDESSCRPGAAESFLQRGDAVAQVCSHLLNQGIRPDVVIAHSGWGEALRLRQVFPTTPLIVYPELWLTPRSLGYGMGPLLNSSLSHDVRHELAVLNLVTALAIEQADVAVVPSHSQLKSFPTALQKRMHVIAEGVDLTRLRPDPEATFHLPHGPCFRPGDPLVTLSSRALEPLRGLRQALRAWPLVAAAHPTARLVLVGEHEPCYGAEKPLQATHLADALGAMPANTDVSRIHHLGRLPYSDLVALLQCSACHLSLSYPYTLSWSVLEALACGAPLITNPEHPLSAERVPDQVTLQVPFADHEGLADAILRLLGDAELRQSLGLASREWLRQTFSDELVQARYAALFDQLLGHPGPSAIGAKAQPNPRDEAVATS